MGCSASSYFGPIILCLKGPRLTEEVHSFCPNCTKISFGNFCAICGAKIEERRKTKTVSSVSFNDLAKAFEDNGLDVDSIYSPEYLSKGDHQIYLPNQPRGGLRKFSMDSESSFFILEDEFDKQKEIDWLKSAYQAELLVLEKLYRAVNVKWAFCNYWS